MLTKEKIIKTIKAMPENEFEEIEVLLERLILLEKIESAEDDIKAGRVYANDQMREIIKSWFPSSGQNPQTAI